MGGVSEGRVVLTVRLPAGLRRRLYAVRGERSLNAEIVARLEKTFEVDGALEAQARSDLGGRLGVPSEARSVAQSLSSRDGSCAAYAPFGTRCRICGQVHT